MSDVNLLRPFKLEDGATETRNIAFVSAWRVFKNRIIKSKRQHPNLPIDNVTTGWVQINVADQAIGPK